MAVALIIHRCTLAKAAEGGDYPSIPARQAASLGHGQGVQGIPDDDLDSQGMQLAGHVGMAHQGNDPVTQLQCVVGEGAAQSATGTEDECGWHDRSSRTKEQA